MIWSSCETHGNNYSQDYKMRLKKEDNKPLILRTCPRMFRNQIETRWTHIEISNRHRNINLTFTSPSPYFLMFFNNVSSSEGLWECRLLTVEDVRDNAELVQWSEECLPLMTAPEEHLTPLSSTIDDLNFRNTELCSTFLSLLPLVAAGHQPSPLFQLHLLTPMPLLYFQEGPKATPGSTYMDKIGA